MPRTPTAIRALPIAAACTVMLLGSGPALADLKLCNTTSSRIGVAIGYRDQTGWTTEGWWTLAAQTCETLYKGALAAVSGMSMPSTTTAAANGRAILHVHDRQGIHDSGGSGVLGRGYQAHRLLRGRHPGGQRLDHPPDRSQRRGRETQMRRSRRVKIVATLGPASYAPEMIAQALRGGRRRVPHQHEPLVLRRGEEAARRRAHGGGQLRPADRHPGRPAGSEVPRRRDRRRQRRPGRGHHVPLRHHRERRLGRSRVPAASRRSSRPSSPATPCCSTTARSA